MLNIGIVGCGAIGRDHCRRIQELVPGAQVVAASDYYKASAEGLAQKYNLKVYENGDDLCRADEVDAVVITCSDDFHAHYILEAMKAGKWVFCEKPLAPNPEDCLKIIEEEVKIGKRKLQVGFMRRYDPGYAEMKRIIDSGEIGEPLMVHACHRVVSEPEGYTTDMAVSNSCVHEIELMRWMLDDEYDYGQVLKVRQNSVAKDRIYETPQMILLATKKGILIDVEMQPADAYGYDVQCQVVCEKGTVNLPDPYAVIKRTTDGRTVPILHDWKDRFITAYDIEFQEWVKSIESGTLKGSSAWDGYVTCVTADTVNKTRGTKQFLEIKTIEKPDLYK